MRVRGAQAKRRHKYLIQGACLEALPSVDEPQCLVSAESFVLPRFATTRIECPFHLRDPRLENSVGIARDNERCGAKRPTAGSTGQETCNHTLLSYRPRSMLESLTPHRSSKNENTENSPRPSGYQNALSSNTRIGAADVWLHTMPSHSEHKMRCLETHPGVGARDLRAYPSGKIRNPGEFAANRNWSMRTRLLKAQSCKITHLTEIDYTKNHVEEQQKRTTSGGEKYA